MKEVQTPRIAQDPARVLRERVKAGLQQKDLAGRVGISPAQLCRIEKGKSGASVTVLRRLADEFGCPIAQLLPPEPRSVARRTAA